MAQQFNNQMEPPQTLSQQQLCSTTAQFARFQQQSRQLQQSAQMAQTGVHQLLSQQQRPASQQQLQLSESNNSRLKPSTRPLMKPHGPHVPSDKYVRDVNGQRQCLVCGVGFNSAIMEATHIMGRHHQMRAEREDEESKADWVPAHGSRHPYNYQAQPPQRYSPQQPLLQQAQSGLAQIRQYPHGGSSVQRFNYLNHFCQQQPSQMYTQLGVQPTHQMFRGNLQMPQPFLLQNQQQSAMRLQHNMLGVNQAAPRLSSMHSQPLSTHSHLHRASHRNGALPPLASNRPLSASTAMSHVNLSGQGPQRAYRPAQPIPAANPPGPRNPIDKRLMDQIDAACAADSNPLAMMERLGSHLKERALELSNANQSTSAFAVPPQRPMAPMQSCSVVSRRPLKSNGHHLAPTAASAAAPEVAQPPMAEPLPQSLNSATRVFGLVKPQ